MAKIHNANLKLAERQGKETERREEEESWKLTADEVAGRVREIRRYLEEFSGRLAGLKFDILNSDSRPPSIDCGEVTRTWELAERLNPLIAGYSDRAHDKGGDAATELKTELAETAFAIGVLAGAIFQGASKREIDRLEQGLIHAIISRHWQVKS